MPIRAELLGLALALGFGCATSGGDRPVEASADLASAPPASAADVASAPPRAADPTLDDYRIQTGDEIEIVFPLNPELTVRTFVRPDGMISLELVDEIRAEGLSTAELTEHLLNAYSTELRDPDISVNVVSMAARIYVDGHVERPGEFPWSRQVTAMQAVALAGGLRDTADGEHLLVVRRGPGGEHQLLELDLDEVGEGRSSDIHLAAFDAVYVPSSRVADLNLWIDQYIRKNIPVSPRDVIPRDTGGGGGGGTSVGPVDPN
jgi:protein involved in polysaccharide export with SLBB domain